MKTLMMKKSKDKRTTNGGARANAGRKKKFENAVSKTFRFEAAEMELFEQLYPNANDKMNELLRLALIKPQS